jgi:hypothetical protein
MTDKLAFVARFAVLIDGTDRVHDRLFSIEGSSSLSDP